MTLLGRILNTYQDCTGCTLSECRDKVVFGSGNKKAKILIIKKTPSELENLHGDHYTQDLKFLTQCWGQATKSKKGLYDISDDLLEKTFITQAVLCRPTVLEGEFAGKYREVKDKELNACRDRLHKTVYAIDPHVIIALGSHTVKTLEGKRRGKSETKVRLTGKKEELFTINVDGLYGKVPYSVIPCHDHDQSLRSGDYDYEAGQVLSIVKAMSNAIDIVKALEKEDNLERLR